MKSQKIKIILLLQLYALILFSCNNNDFNDANSLPKDEAVVNLTSEEYASIAFDNPRELSESEVVSIAENFISAQEEKEAEVNGTKASTLSTSFTVKTKYYSEIKVSSSGTLNKSSSDETNAINVPIYEIYVTKGDKTGLAIVSADERAQKVIAYIPSVDDTERLQNPGAQYLEEVAKRSLMSNIADINHLQDSLRIQTLEKVSKKLGISQKNIKFDEIKEYISVNDEPLSKFAPIQAPPSQVLSYVLPMCKTQWDQDAPYNKQLPIGLRELFNGETNYPTGCGVVAVAQVIASIQPSMTVYGTTINWTYLAQNPKIVEPSYFSAGDPEDKRNMVAYFIKDIYTKTNSYPEFNEKGYVTGVLTSESSCETYIKLYTNCTSRQNWNSDVVRNSILALRPVFAAGSGTKSDGTTSNHAFVLDGYLLCKLYYGSMPVSTTSATKELVKLYDLYFHANLGWGGNSDGYYLINQDTSVDFETSNLNTTYRSGNLRIISDIRKK